MARRPDQRRAPRFIRAAGDALHLPNAGRHAVCGRTVGRRRERAPATGVGRHAARRWVDRAPVVGHDPQTLSLRLELRGRLDDYETAIYLGKAQDNPIQRASEGASRR